MNLSSNFYYFREGFTLANKSFTIYLISASITLVNEILALQVLKPLLFLTTVTSLLMIGYSLSLPALLKMRMEEKTIDVKSYFGVILKSIKRSFFPLILLGFLIVLFVLVLVIILFLAKLDPMQMMQSLFKNLQNNQLNTSYLLFTFVSSFIVASQTFTTTLFSIEKQGLIKSVIGSISLSLKNLSFVLYVFIINFFLFLVSSSLTVLPPSIASPIFSLLSGYIDIIVVSAVLLFYLKRLQKNHSS
ncbi:MAG: hypothetical protein HYV40_06120 [Candidatus Levybacteria bacterium]|nr:hypothetical protein [Candidatus Levybacteria bacterium]